MNDKDTIKQLVEETFRESILTPQANTQLIESACRNILESEEGQDVRAELFEFYEAVIDDEELTESEWNDVRTMAEEDAVMYLIERGGMRRRTLQGGVIGAAQGAAMGGMALGPAGAAVGAVAGGLHGATTGAIGAAFFGSGGQRRIQDRIDRGNNKIQKWSRNPRENADKIKRMKSMITKWSAEVKNMKARGSGKEGLLRRSNDEKIEQKRQKEARRNKR